MSKCNVDGHENANSYSGNSCGTRNAMGRAVRLQNVFIIFTAEMSIKLWCNKVIYAFTTAERD